MSKKDQVNAENGAKKEKKGFLKVLKSDPQTIEEANDKTNKMCIFVAIIFGVFVVLFSLFHIFIGLGWAVIAAFIILFMRIKWRSQNKKNFCSECGTRFYYDRCVSWETTDISTVSVPHSSNSQNAQVVEKDVANVHITCTCENCGSVKEFSKKFDVVLYYSDGREKSNNLKVLVANYFKL
ncbi:MAG: hypothetical protein IKB02_04930 [Clostridia bacterium]|nr:hypothetical protein [Clostridia bacterium]